MPNYPGKTPGTRRITVYHNGQQREKVIEGTKKDGDVFEAKFRLELQARSATVERVEPRFGDFCDGHYRIHAEQHLKASTWRNVRIYQVASLVEFFGQARLYEISTRMVDEYKRVRLEDDDLAPVSVNNELRVLGTILKFAKEARGFAVANDLKINKLPRRGEPERTPWSVAELERLFASTKKIAPQLLPLWLFLLNTGCRQGEAMAARWTWVDLETGLLRIPSTKEWQPKNNKARSVPLSDGLKALLSGHRQSETWVFPAAHGGRYACFPKALFRECREDAKLQGGAHTLRHTYASHFLAAPPEQGGGDLFLLAKILGHSHTRVTEIYAHLLPDHLSRGRNAVNFMPAIAATTAPLKIARNSGSDSGRPKK